MKCVFINKSFYFLICATEHVEASALDIRLDGGAGYPMEDGVALAVYLNETEGVVVQAALSMQGAQISLLRRKVDYLYFKRINDKRKAPICVGAFESLYGFLQVLSKEIIRLDKGATQQSVRRSLEGLRNLFSYHYREYDNVYPAYARLCKGTAEELNKLMADTVFVNDLRYLLCELAVGYLFLAQEFSL